MKNITFFEPVFQPAFCHWLLDQAREGYRKGTGYDASNQDWDPRITRGSTRIRVRNLDGVAEKLILSLLRDRGAIDNQPHGAMLFAGETGSFIFWHNDAMYGGATTVYLNERWEEDWGGQFLYREAKDAEPISILPRFNSGLRNSAALDHRTLPVTQLAPEPRFSLQVFAIKE